MEGFPEGSISVTKDGQSFTSNSSRINASGIWIPSLTVADAGTYVVTSTNEAGAASATLSLTVYCKYSILLYLFYWSSFQVDQTLLLVIMLQEL